MHQPLMEVLRQRKMKPPNLDLLLQIFKNSDKKSYNIKNEPVKLHYLVSPECIDYYNISQIVNLLVSPM